MTPTDELEAEVRRLKIELNGAKDILMTVADIFLSNDMEAVGGTVKGIAERLEERI